MTAQAGVIVQRAMVEFLCQLLLILRSLFKARARLEAGILVLCQQLNVLGRRAPSEYASGNWDRFVAKLRRPPSQG
jgi:hypothetical protein